MNNVPMSLFPLDTSKKISYHFRGISEVIQLAFPNYRLTLEQSGLYISCDEFFSIALLNTSIFFVVLGSVFSLLLNSLHIAHPILFGFIIGLFIAAMIFLQIVLGLQIRINRKVKSIDANLVFGLKMILVEINSGVSLFDAIIMVATYELGELSNVFREIAKKLNTGEKEEEVLKDAATKNPSLFLRKILLQIVSGLKVGSPLSKIISESLTSLERQQNTEIMEYGSSLRVLTLVFMMLGVIIPAMGLSFLVVINSLPGVGIGKELPWLLVILVAVFEFMLIGFIKSKRPSLIGGV